MLCAACAHSNPRSSAAPEEAAEDAKEGEHTPQCLEPSGQSAALPLVAQVHAACVLPLLLRSVRSCAVLPFVVLSLEGPPTKLACTSIGSPTDAAARCICARCRS